jgi:exosortase
MTKRAGAFWVFCAATLGLYFMTLKSLFFLALHEDAYSYILVTPFICAYFFYRKRNKIVLNARYSIVIGSVIACTGLLFRFIQWFSIDGFNSKNHLFLMSISMLLFFVGGFVSLYGVQIFKHATFPAVFLVFIIPIPSFLLNGIIHFFQTGTAIITDGLLKLSGITFFREGLSFHLPTISIEIAPECSGIRSSTALIITAVVAAQLFLRSISGKIILVFLSIPFAVLKNGIRVATLSVLGDRVDAHFITHSNLHHKGGFVFFLIALALLLACMYAIARIETGRKKDGKITATMVKGGGGATV